MPCGSPAQMTLPQNGQNMKTTSGRTEFCSKIFIFIAIPILIDVYVTFIEKTKTHVD